MCQGNQKILVCSICRLLKFSRCKILWMYAVIWVYVPDDAGSRKIDRKGHLLRTYSTLTSSGYFACAMAIVAAAIRFDDCACEGETCLCGV